MPKNVHGGNKAKKGRNVPRGNKFNSKNIILPEEELEFIGHVVGVLGDCRFNVEILTSTSRSKTVMCHLSNGKRKLGRILLGAHVLFSMRGYEDKGDILYLYNPDEVSQLIKMEEIIDITAGNLGQELGFNFNSGADETVEANDNIEFI